MSFAASLATPVTAGLKSAGGLIQSPTLRTMARTIGVILGAGVLAAGHQIAYEEGRGLIHNMRTGTVRRRQQNTTLLLVLMNSGLPLELQDRLRRSRDVVRAGLAMLADEKAKLPPEHHAIIHAALMKTTQGELLRDC
jgi:hypothetical protein